MIVPVVMYVVPSCAHKMSHIILNSKWITWFGKFFESPNLDSFLFSKWRVAVTQQSLIEEMAVLFHLLSFQTI